jgi:hypothetical protein
MGEFNDSTPWASPPTLTSIDINNVRWLWASSVIQCDNINVLIEDQFMICSFEARHERQPL